MKKPILSKMIMLAGVASALALAQVPQVAQAQTKYIGWVNGNGAEPNPLAVPPDLFDIAWVARLRAQGYVVTMIDDGFGVGAGINTNDLFIVSQDCGSGSVATSFTGNGSRPKPTMCYEPAGGVPAAMCPGTSNGGRSQNTNIWFTPISVFAYPPELVKGLPAAGIAMYTVNNNNNGTSIAQYGTGASIFKVGTNVNTHYAYNPTNPVAAAFGGGTAKRMLMPLYDDADPALMTADAWKLLDNAVKFMLGIVDKPTVTWVGDSSALWNTNVANLIWTNAVEGGALTNYIEGYGAIFNDSSSFTTVNLVGNVFPGTVSVANSINNYTITGGGTIGGGDDAKLVKTGTGTLTLSSVNATNQGGTTISNGTLVVTSSSDVILNKLSGAGALTKQGTGKLTLTGANTLTGTATVQNGTLEVLTTAAGAKYSVDASATLQVTDAGGTMAAASLSFASGSTTLSIADGAVSSLVPVIRAPIFTNAGTIAVTYTATALAPGSIVLIDYDAATSEVGAFSTLTLPSGYTGELVTNTVNSSIDLVITGTPAKVWVGNLSGLWDTFALNWFGGVTYAEGNLVQFDDSATTTSVDVNSGGTVSPGLMYVTNATAYSFSVGTIITPMLVKDGSGTMSVLSSNFISAIDLRAGTLSYGVTATEAGTVSGAGTLQVASGTLTLSGNNVGFTGPVTVSGGTLTLGANNALGATSAGTTIASGAVLNVNARSVPVSEMINVSGDGISSLGAIVNYGANQANALGSVTLQADTTFGGTGNWDIRPATGTTGVLNMAMSGSYNLTKVGVNSVGLVDLNVGSSLANVTIAQGTLLLQGQTLVSFGNESSTITVSSGSTVGNLNLFNGTSGFFPVLKKNIVLGGNGIISKGGSQNAAVVGAVNVGANTLTLDCGAGSLIISNGVTGGGNMAKINTSTVTLMGANNLSGTTVVSNGTLRLASSTIAGASTIVSTNATLGVVRDALNGQLAINSPSTLVLNGGAGTNTLQFDLSTFGGGSTAVLDVSGSVLTTNASYYRVEVQADINNLTTGTTVLFKYAPGAFTNQLTSFGLPAGVVGVVTNDTSLNQVVMLVTSVSRNLEWLGNLDSNWNIDSTANWVQTGTTNLKTYRELGVGDNVTLSSVASNFTVNVPATVTPRSMLFSGTNNYSVNVSGGAAIAGLVQVQVQVGATNTVTLTGNNTYTGGTFFDNGLTIVSSDANLGGYTAGISNGVMRWSGGSVQFTESATNTRSLYMENSGQDSRIIVDTNKTVQLGGIYNMPSDEELIKSGRGDLVITNRGNMRLQVWEGTATVNGNAGMTNGFATDQAIGGTNGVSTLVLKDNAALIMGTYNSATTLVLGSGLNVADGNGVTNAIVRGDLFITNNALLFIRDLMVGKRNFADGRIYQSGGTIFVSTNGNTGGATRIAGEPANNDATNAFGAHYMTGGLMLNSNKTYEVGTRGTGVLLVDGSTTVAYFGALSLGVNGQGRGSAVVTNGGTVVSFGNINIASGAESSGSLVVNSGGKVSGNNVQVGNNTNAGPASLTLGGGTLTVNQIQGGGSTNLSFTSTFTIDGGTLVARQNAAGFLQGLTSATIGAGGLALDTVTNNITINQNMVGSGGLTKTGTGTLKVNIMSYTGDTVINAGTLEGNATVAGSTLQGDLVVNVNGTVVPGGSSYGPINANDVTLSGTANMQIGKADEFNYYQDLVQAGGTVTLGGVLNVSFLLHDNALMPNDEFELFKGLVGGVVGSFTATNLPAVDTKNGNNITWTVDGGKIRVLTSVAPITLDPPPTLTTVVAGGQLQFSWGSEYLGYTLQAQTNTLAVGLSDNWVNIANSETVTSLNIDIDPAQPVTAYRLLYVAP